MELKPIKTKRFSKSESVSFCLIEQIRPKVNMQIFFIFALIVLVQSKDITSRIAGGTPADITSPIYLPLIRLTIEFERGIRTCGGFLHSTLDRIVTAASCVWE